MTSSKAMRCGIGYVDEVKVDKDGKLHMSVGSMETRIIRGAMYAFRRRLQDITRTTVRISINMTDSFEFGNMTEKI